MASESESLESRSRQKPLKALAYMTRFRCIGPACEDICCRGWRVPLDQDDVEQLNLLGQDREDIREKLKEGLGFYEPEAVQGKRTAYFRWNKSGSCHFLECGSCTLHRDFGEAAIPKACASYPRRLAVYADRVELSGSLSCPEVARLCLLPADSCEIVPFGGENLPHGMQITSDQPGEESYYERSFEDIYKIIHWFLRFEGFPIQELVFFLSYFSKKIHPFFFRETEVDPSRRLTAVLEKTDDLQFLKKILETYHGVTVFTPVAANLLFLVLMLRWDHRHCDRYNRLVGACLRELGIELSFDGEGHLTTTSELLYHMWPRLRRRRLRLDETYGARIERYWRNYNIHFWHQDHYTNSPSLWRHSQKAILSFAAVKLLFYAHPSLTELSKSPRPEVEAGPILDAAVVDAAQSFHRGMAHNQALMNRLYEVFAQKEMDSLQEWISLLKL